MSLQCILCVLCTLSLWLTAPFAVAQWYPSKPVRLIVPFPPGGSTDLVARTFSSRLGEILGQQIVIEYRGGAGGSIGAAEAARAAPDGYTFLIVWDTHAVNHHVYKVQYDFVKSFEPITLLVQSPGILVAHPSVGPSSIKELIAYAKANPGKVTYGSGGVGSSNHLSGILFSEMAGVQITHVPYKGGGPLIADLLGGHLDMVFGTLPLLEQYVRSGKMKAIATLSKTRIRQFPNLPTASETLPGFEAKTWFGLLAPAATPREIIARLQQAMVTALADEKVREQLVNRGFDIVGSTPEAFAAFLREQSEAAGKLVRAAGIKPE